MKFIPVIQIPEPCHENWEAMQESDKGKFCINCSKNVIDFTNMNDAQIVDIFKKSKSNICGRFYEDQLERPLLLPKNRFIKWNYFNASIISFLLSNKLIAQIKTTKVDTIQQSNILKTNKLQKYSLIKTTGTITDEKGYPIAGVSILLKGTNIGTITNDEGFFKIIIPQNSIHQDSLHITSIGFKETEVEMKSYQKIILLNDVESLKDVCVISPQNIKKTITGSIATINASILNKNKSSILYQIVKPLITAYENLTDTKTVKIFPNPANKNSELNVQINKVGSYVINLLNSQAKIVSSKRVTTANKKEIVGFRLPSSLPSGIYFIALVNINTKKLATEKLVVN